jgi:hypothetical protein
MADSGMAIARASQTGRNELRVAAMQPYFFPYVGYFQMVKAVHTFVFLDDVQFSRGWVNRNRVQRNGEVAYLTIPLSGGRQSLQIDQVRVQDPSVWTKQLLSRLHHAYAKSPQYSTMRPWLDWFFEYDSDLVSDWAQRSVEAVAELCGFGTAFTRSSTEFASHDLRGQARILEICQDMQASIYLNLPGGRELYDSEVFAQKGVELKFVEPAIEPYPQTLSTSEEVFVGSLSILDLLMWVPTPEIVDRYLVPKSIAG